MKLLRLYTCAVATLFVGTALGQQPDPAAQTPAPAPASRPWSVGAFDVSGLLDGYYSFNFNHPASGFNTLRNFEVKANQFSLNMAKLSVTHAPDPVGFTLDLGWEYRPVHSPGVSLAEACELGRLSVRFWEILHFRRRGADRE
jgi:hypothetical protein